MPYENDYQSQNERGGLNSNLQNSSANGWNTPINNTNVEKANLNQSVSPTTPLEQTATAILNNVSMSNSQDAAPSSDKQEKYTLAKGDTYAIVASKINFVDDLLRDWNKNFVSEDLHNALLTNGVPDKFVGEEILIQKPTKHEFFDTQMLLNNANQFGEQDPIVENIIVDEKLKKHEPTYKAFLEWQNSSQGQAFCKLYNPQGKYKKFVVEFVLHNFEKGEEGTNARTLTLAYNPKTKTEKELSAFEDIIRFRLDKKTPTKPEQGEVVKFRILVSPVQQYDVFQQVNNPLKRPEAPMQELVKRNIYAHHNRALSILHETQHVQITSNDMLTKGQKYYGALNQHLMMKDDRFPWMKERYDFLKMRRPDLTDEQIKLSVNGFNNEN